MNTINNSNLKKAVIYCRVSTKEQVEEGNSLNTQEKICREYCLKHGYDIGQIFIEQGESAKTADRTELKKLLVYCSIKKNEVKAVIIYKLDRLSRNTDDYSQLRLVLKRYGIEIKSTSEHFENNPVGRFMENTMANIAQFDNDIRTERSIGGMREAARDGRYVWMAPIGYDNVKVAGRSTIAQNETAPLMHRAFELIATNSYTIQEVRRIMTNEGLLNRKGKPLSTSYFYVMLTNVIYTGWIVKFGEKHKGSFEPIVPESLFDQAQRILKRKGRKNLVYTTDNADFPLRRFVVNQFGKKLTGSWSQGRYKKYPYYRFGGNLTNHNRDKFEEAYMKYLDQFSFDNTKFKKLKELVKIHLSKSTIQQSKDRGYLKKQILNLTEKKTTIIKKNLDGTISDNVLKIQLEIIDNELFEANVRLSNLPEIKTNYEEGLSFIEEYLKNPSKIWRNAEIGIKLKLQWFQFPKGLTYQNNIFGTTEMSIFFRLKEVFSTWVSYKVHLRNEISNNSDITNNNTSTLYWQQIGNEIIELTEILKEIKEDTDKSKIQLFKKSGFTGAIGSNNNNHISQIYNFDHLR